MSQTDHTCNGGCARCVPELDPSSWAQRHRDASEQADMYRSVLKAILSNISDPLTFSWLGEAHVAVVDQHQFIVDVHHARRLLSDVGS